MLRMRTINEAHAELKAADPDTALTPHFIRQLILSGSVPHVKAGNKYLVELDALERYLSNPTPAAPDAPAIRMVSERGGRV